MDRSPITSLYVGATEQTRSCGDRTLAARERLGRPRPDSRYAAFCEPTRGRGAMVYRYPADFLARVRSRCGFNG